MNFYPIYRNKKLLPWIKWWLIKGNKVTPKHLSEWINSASAITLTGVYKGSPLLYLNLKGNTSQTGTPTPEAPVPVNVVKGNNTIKINDTDYQVNLKSKNIFDETTIVAGDIRGSNSTTRLSSRQALWLDVGTYTMSTNAVSPFRYACSVQNVSPPPLSSYPTYILDSGWKTGNTSYTFTLETAGYFVLALSKTNNATLTVEEVSDFEYQLEKASEPTTYEPYYDYELCKIGDYQDVIYKENNKYYVEKYINKVTFNSNSSIGAASSSTDGYARAGWGKSSDNIKFVGNDKIGVLCDKFLGKPQNDNTTSVTGSHWYCSNSNVNDYMIMFRCGDSEISSSNFITYLKNNVSFYHVLATSTTTEITETNLINQLEAIYNAKLQSGTNTITQTPEDLPFYLNFQYYEKG